MMNSVFFSGAAGICDNLLATLSDVFPWCTSSTEGSMHEALKSCIWQCFHVFRQTCMMNNLQGSFSYVGPSAPNSVESKVHYKYMFLLTKVNSWAQSRVSDSPSVWRMYFHIEWQYKLFCFSLLQVLFDCSWSSPLRCSLFVSFTYSTTATKCKPGDL